MTTSTSSLATLFRADVDSGFDPAQWNVRDMAGLPGGDGKLTADAGSVVCSTGAPEHGEPRFAPVAPGNRPEDLVRWLALVDRQATTGLPGFDLLPGSTLEVAATMAATVFGRPREHDAADALVQGAAGLLCLDVESRVGFDLVLNGTQVCAVYERLPLPDGSAGSFRYDVPVAAHAPGQEHDLTISVSAAGDGCATYAVDGDEVLRVQHPGLPELDSRYRTASTAGPVGPVQPRQLAAGLALFGTDVEGRGVELALRGLAVSLRSQL